MKQYMIHQREDSGQAVKQGGNACDSWPWEMVLSIAAAGTA